MTSSRSLQRLIEPFPTAATSPDNKLITKFESAPGGVITPFFAQNGAKQNIAPSRRGAETDFSMFAPPSAAHNPDPRENLVPGRPFCAKLASATPMARRVWQHFTRL